MDKIITSELVAIKKDSIQSISVKCCIFYCQQSGQDSNLYAMRMTPFYVQCTMNNVYQLRHLTNPFVYLSENGYSCTCFHPRDGSFAPQYLRTEFLLGNHWLLMVCSQDRIRTCLYRVHSLTHKVRMTISLIYDCGSTPLPDYVEVENLFVGGFLLTAITTYSSFSFLKGTTK